MEKPSPHQTAFLNQQEAARLLGVSRDKLWRMAKLGEIRTYIDPLNKRLRLYAVEDLERLRMPKPAR